MNWQPVTQGPWNPEPANDAIPYVLTPSERTRASIASIDLERARRQQNERDAIADRRRKARLAERALRDWTPDDAA